MVDQAGFPVLNINYLELLDPRPPHCECGDLPADLLAHCLLFYAPKNFEFFI